ncbi:ABC transporter permease [Bifidobacterium anseris]|uniref:ABC transporter permease n=1 Tax=Bifidobacterium anseris TaxID=2020963 RepID=A0A2N5J2F5_9BIFI|nr:ABC transporter permease [Bifidobacterium anseris]PLS28400.1 ABC transporter permease [Bifidobacterium anseris]
MFIITNALRNITRNKGRSALMIIIVAIVTAAATIGLAIVQAAQRARTDALANTTLCAQITLDRGSLMDKSRSNGAGDGKPDMDAMREAVAGKTLTLADYEQYAKTSYGVASSYYIETASVASANDGIEAVDTNGGTIKENADTKQSTQSDETNNNAQSNKANDGAQSNPPQMPDAGTPPEGSGAQMTVGDFSLVGFSSDEAIANAPNGSFTMDSGQVFGYDTDDDNDVIISDTLAAANDVEVGDSIVVANVANEDTTYTFKVVGIYSNTNDSSAPMGGPMSSNASDPANAIYTSASTLDKLGLTADKTINVTDAHGDTRAMQAATLSYTYVFDGKSKYDEFVRSVKAAGLGDEYTVTSQDVQQYEASLLPIENLAKFARTLLIVVLAVGAVILVVMTIFNIRERKYEIGVLTAIGVRKAKVAAQYAVELLVVTLIGLAVGVGVGAGASVPVSNALLSSQIEAQHTQLAQQREQFGRDMQPGGGPRPDADATGSSGTDATGGNSTGGTDDVPSNGQQLGNDVRDGFGRTSQAIAKLNATVNWATLGWMLLVGLGLTLLAAFVAAVFVMRYEPLQILADRS